MFWNKRITVLLILLLLLSTFVTVLHFHEDLKDHDDCPICIASNHQSATGPSVPSFNGIPCYSEKTVVTPTVAFTDNFFSYSLKSRAPPV